MIREVVESVELPDRCKFLGCVAEVQPDHVVGSVVDEVSRNVFACMAEDVMPWP